MKRAVSLHLFAIAALLAVFAVLHWSAFIRISTHCFGGARGDAGIYLYLLAQNAESFFSLPSSGFDASMFHPFGNSLAFTDNFLLPSLAAKPLLALHLPLPLVYNLLFLTACLLNGYLTFCLARAFGYSDTAAFVSGVAFMLCSFLSSQWVHPQLQYAFFFPAGFLALLFYYRRRSLFAASLVGATVYGAFLSAMYYGFFLAFLLAIVGLGLLALRPRAWGWSDATRILFGNAPWAGLVVLLAEPYREVREAFGGRNLYEAKYYSGSLLSLFSTSKNNWLWGELLHGLAKYESRLFPGVCGLLLCLIVVVSPHGVRAAFAKRDRHWLLMQVAGIAVVGAAVSAFVLSWLFAAWLAERHNYQATLLAAPQWLLLGLLLLSLHISGRADTARAELRTSQLCLLTLFLFAAAYFATQGILGGHWPEAIRPGLFYQWYRFVPGFDAIRAPGRFAVVAAVALALLMGGGVYCLQQSTWCRASVKNRLLAAMLAALLMVVEFWPVDLPLQQEPPAPAIYQRAAELSGPGAIVALPFGIITDVPRYTLLQTDYMRNLQPAGRSMVNGYSGKMPAYQQFLEKKTIGFPDRLSIAYLGRIADLRYLVYDRRWDPAFVAEQFESKLAALGSDLRLLERDTGGNMLFELDPVLRLKNLELYLAPQRNYSRQLAFAVRIVNAHSDSMPLELRTEIGFSMQNGTRQPVVEVLPLKRTQDWQQFTLVLPPSVDPVIPHKIRFQSPKLHPGEQIEIRIDRSTSGSIASNS